MSHRVVLAKGRFIDVDTEGDSVVMACHVLTPVEALELSEALREASSRLALGEEGLRATLKFRLRAAVAKMRVKYSKE